MVILKFFALLYVGIGLLLYAVTFRTYKHDTEETKRLLESLDQKCLLSFLYCVLCWPAPIYDAIFSNDED